MTATANSGGAPFLPPMAQAALVPIAGFADVVGFLRYEAFACQMTGNTLVLAVSVFHRSRAQSVYYVVMIACVVLGVLASSGLIRFGHSPVLSLAIDAAVLAVRAPAT